MCRLPFLVVFGFDCMVSTELDLDFIKRILLTLNFLCLCSVIEVQFPCIRAIVIKASKIKVGSLFIVTYTGGTIGR